MFFYLSISNRVISPGSPLFHFSFYPVEVITTWLTWSRHWLWHKAPKLAWPLHVWVFNMMAFNRTIRLCDNLPKPNVFTPFFFFFYLVIPSGGLFEIDLPFLGNAQWDIILTLELILFQDQLQGEASVDIPFLHFWESIKDRKPWGALNHITKD